MRKWVGVIVLFVIVVRIVSAWNIYIDGDGSDWGSQNDIGTIQVGDASQGVFRGHYHCDGDLLYLSASAYPPLSFGDPLTPTIRFNGDAKIPLSWRLFDQDVGWEAVYGVPEGWYQISGDVAYSDGQKGEIDVVIALKCANLPPRTPCPSCSPVSPTVEVQDYRSQFLPFVQR